MIVEIIWTIVNLFLFTMNEKKSPTYIKKHNFFNPKVSNFVTSDLYAQEIEKKCNNDMIKLLKEDNFFKIKKYLMQRKQKL